MHERIPLIYHSWVPADFFNVKYLTSLALLFAILQGTPLAIYCYSDKAGGVGVFVVTKFCWFLSVFIDLCRWCLSSWKYSYQKNHHKGKMPFSLPKFIVALFFTGVVDCWLYFVTRYMLIVAFLSFSGLLVWCWVAFFIVDHCVLSPACSWSSHSTIPPSQ